MNQNTVRKTALRLIDIRTDILSQYPFFGRLLMRLSFGFADCETAYTDMKRIVFSPDFADKLNDEQLMFVVLHELMHCVLKHCVRGKGKIYLIYNIACDIVVNSIILEAMNLKDIMILDEPVMHIAPDEAEGRNYSAEAVYEMLLKDIDNEFQKNFGHSFLDNHNVWEDISNGILVEALWDAYINKASKAVGDESGIPNSIARVISDINHQTKISWKQVLHDFIQNIHSDYVFTPPDKRCSGDLLLPSFQENIYGSKIENIWFAVDTSGSISSSAISEAFEEIKDAIEQIDNVEGYVSFFDCEITEPVPFDSVDDINTMKPVGGGGTSFDIIFECLAEKFEDELPKVIVIITDGYAEFPNESASLGVPIIWLIVGSEVEPPWGEGVFIDF